MTSETAFTRTRRMPFKDLFNFLLYPRSKSTEIELPEYSHFIGKPNVNKSDFSRRRQYVPATYLKDLNRSIIVSVYGKCAVSTWNGQVLLAGDGTTYSLPDTPALRHKYLQELQLFANLLKDGHTKIVFNADVTYAPISHKRIGDKVFVTGVYSDEYTQKWVRRGTELVAINDMPVIEYGNRYVVPYIPSSTPQWSNTYPFNSINLTKGYRGVPVKLTFKNENKTFDITDNRQSPWGIVNPDMSIQFDSLPGNIGLSRINPMSLWKKLKALSSAETTLLKKR